MSVGGSTVNEPGEDASTSPGWPEIVTWLASASPQNPCPTSSNRSLVEATRGDPVTSSVAEGTSAGERIVLVTRPVRPSILAEIVPGFSGATKSARPVVSVVTLSPFEKAIFTPGVNLPAKSRTAKVARSPVTSLWGKSKIRAPDAAGVCCALQTPGLTRERLTPSNSDIR